MSGVETKTGGVSRFWVAAGMAAGLVALYGFQGNTEQPEVWGHSAVWWMVNRWNGSGGDLSHGWVIPLVSGFIIWRRRRELVAAPRRVSYLGLGVVVLALLLHWIGVRTQLTRLSLLSLVGLLWGIPFYLCGPRVARLLLFPCAYLIYCIPMSFLNSVTLPLRLMASAAATAVLNGLGVVAVRSGTAIRSLADGGFNLEVADPCSGLRSLLAMTALAAAYAFFMQRGLLRKWILFLCAVPIAMAGNIVRIVMIAMIAGWLGKDVAVHVYEKYSGLLVFAVAVLLLMAFGRILNADFRGNLNRWKNASVNTHSS